MYIHIYIHIDTHKHTNIYVYMCTPTPKAQGAAGSSVSRPQGRAPASEGAGQVAEASEAAQQMSL